MKMVHAILSFGNFKFIFIKIMLNKPHFWIDLYHDENNPHFLRTKQLSELMHGWDWEGTPLNCFNDYCNMFLYTNQDLGKELKKFDQKLFKYYYKKMREYRNNGYIFDETDENYLNFINYFKTYV